MRTNILRHPHTGAPIGPVGFRRDGRPIMPVLGGAPEDDDKGKDGEPGSAVAANMSYRQVCNRLDDIRDDLQRLNAREDREGGLSSDDTVRFGELTAEFDELLARKGRLEREAALAKVQRANIKAVGTGSGARPGVVLSGDGARGGNDYDSDPLGEPDSIRENRWKNPWAVHEIRMGLSREARGAELRSRALDAIEKMSGTTDNRRETATRLLERWDTTDGRLAEQVLVTSSPDYMRAFAKLASSQGRAQLRGDEADAVERAMSLTDANGGYLVPFQLDPTVILTSDGSLNQIRQAARTVIATGDVWHGVSAGAVQWSFDAEAEEVSDDSPTFAQPDIPVKTARGFVPISLEAMMDAQNVAQDVAQLLADGKDNLESVTFINGDGGAKTPRGIMTAMLAAAGTDATLVVASAVSGSLQDTDVYAVHDGVAARYRPRSSWLANTGFYSMVRQLDSAGGAALWERIGNDRPAQLVGRPVYEAEAMDGKINAGDNYLAVFGDFSNFVIADRIGMTVEFIPHLFGPGVTGAGARGGFPTGQRGWFAYYRVGSDVVNPRAFRLLDVKA